MFSTIASTVIRCLLTAFALAGSAVQAESPLQTGPAIGSTLSTLLRPVPRIVAPRILITSEEEEKLGISGFDR